MKDKVQISTTMDQDTLNNLREYSKTSGVPIAEIIRRSVRSYLSQAIQRAKKEEEV
jgi:hypothetical protein